MKVDAILSGGGVKGVALIGAVSVFEESGYEFGRIAGTSAGAIVGGLLAAGCSSEEIRSEWMSANFRRQLFNADQNEEESEFASSAEPDLAEDAEPIGEWALKPRFSEDDIAKRVISTRRLGLFPSSGFGAIFRRLLEKHGVRTFKDLRLPEGPDGKVRYRIQMVGADVSRGRLVLLPQDIVQYEGFSSPDDLDVTLAMRISMSVPAIFRPVALRYKATGKVSYLVDGGILSQFPIAYFGALGSEPRPAIGFRIRRPDRMDELIRVHGPVSLLMACALTAIEAHDAQLAETKDWQRRTVLISGLDIPELNFLLSHEQKQALYDEGVAAAKAFLANPESRAYLERPRGAGPFQYL